MNIPLHGTATPDEIVAHRQDMINMSGGKGFRPQFMERTMVYFGYEKPSYLLPDRSKRSIKKAETKQAYIEKCLTNPSKARKH